MKFNSGMQALGSNQGAVSSLDPHKNSSSVPILIVIGGATATGKSGLAVALAQQLNLGVISADSRQIYREFDIGTAKPSAKERQRAPHYLIDLCAPTKTVTLAEFQRAAQTVVGTLQQQGAVPLLVGGTGLYIDAVVRGLKIPPVAPQPGLRSQFTQLGQPHSYDLLQSLDPAAAQQIHPNDAVRTQRALEVFYVTGQPISQLQGANPPSYPILYLGLDAEPEPLGVRIAQRTEQMFQQGLVAEVAALAARYGWNLPLMQTLGYREVGRYLRGDISLAEAEWLTVQHTRQFAKRQRTWFRNRAAVARWFNANAPDLVEQVWEEIQGFMRRVGTAPIQPLL